MPRRAVPSDTIVLSSSSSEGGGGGVEEEAKPKSRLSSNKLEMTKRKNKPAPEEEEGKIVDATGGNKREGDVSVSSSSSSIKPSFSSSSCSFPMSRVRRLIVGGGGTNRRATANMRTTHDAVFLVNKAAELFLELFAEDAYVCAMREHKKLISYNHLSSTVYNGRRYDFLSDFVPEKLKAEDALKAKGTN